MGKLKESENVEINNLYNMISNEITLLYWNIGKDIKENILNLEKAEYGKKL